MAKDFRSAGYEAINVNDSYVGGQVRQHGNFSFSRVYESGHEVPAYQPETAYEIFRRSLNNLDVPNGNTSLLGNSDFSTNGPESSFQIKNVVPASPAPACYIWALSGTCTNDQQNAIVNGTAVVKNFLYVGQANASTATYNQSKAQVDKLGSEFLDAQLSRPLRIENGYAGDDEVISPYKQ